MVDAIAVALQRPAAAGLPLLALLAVPAAVVDRGVGLLAFLAACAAYLALLLASGRRRLTRWARLLPGSATRYPAARPGRMPAGSLRSPSLPRSCSD